MSESVHFPIAPVESRYCLYYLEVTFVCNLRRERRSFRGSSVVEVNRSPGDRAFSLSASYHMMRHGLPAASTRQESRGLPRCPQRYPMATNVIQGGADATSTHASPIPFAGETRMCHQYCHPSRIVPPIVTRIRHQFWHRSTILGVISATGVSLSLAPYTPPPSSPFSRPR